MTLFCSVSGYGKTLAVEKTAWQYYNCGYTVINLTDVKLNFENCFAMLPEDIIPEFHRYWAEEYQKNTLEQIPTKIYHPFTFNIPRKKLPLINFFTLPLKSLGRDHFSFLTESHASSETVKLMLNTIDNMKSTDKLFDFIRRIDESVQDKKSSFYGKKITKHNKDFFTSTRSAGTQKDVQQVQSLFLPFKRDYFLNNSTCESNIDFVDMINDQRHYHCLTYKWIQDDKMRYFTILSFLIGIDNALEYARKPVCIVIDEIRRLVPYKSAGYKEYLAEIIKNMLSTIRNKGRGVTVICGTQEYYDIDEDVRNSFTEKLYGRLSTMDIERLSKVHGWNQEQRRTQSSMKKNNFYRVGGSVDKWFCFFPPHAHKEPHHNFFEIYRQYFPFLEQKYTDFIKDMEKSYNDEVERAKEIAKKKEEKEKEEIKKRQQEKEEKSKAKQELEKIKEEQKEKRKENKEELMKQCYEIYTDPTLPEPPSFREIARRLDLSFPTVKKYIEQYSKKKQDLDSRPTAEEMK